MDSSNWWEGQAQSQIQIPGQAMSSEASVTPGMEAADWRTQLQADSRQRIVTKIMETLKKHLPFSGQEGLRELKKIAVRFEEKIYTAATSQSDYLRKISLKMLTMETKSQNPIVNSLQPNAAGSSEIPQIQASDPLRQPHITINQQLLSQRAIPEVPLTEVQILGGAAVAPVMEAGDWRTQLGADPRRRLVNKIMETLKKHLPEFGQEELEKEAVKLEEKNFNTAKSQSDYLRKISMEMLELETKSQNPRQRHTASKQELKYSTSRR